MIEIPLTRGKVALIDDCDAHLAAFKWYANPDGFNWYAVREVMRDGQRQRFHLHREVLGIVDPSVPVDHVSGDGLDCRRQNLRQATRGQNQANRGMMRNNTSGYRGVQWDPRGRTWRARIKVRWRFRHLGQFDTAEAAGRAYDAAARESFGEFARLNFPAEHERAARGPRKEPTT